MNQVALKNQDAIELALVRNDISKLSSQERISFINALCASLGLNPLTKPFAIINLQGRDVVYATKDCTDQLRKKHGISTTIISHGAVGDCYEVHVAAKDATGRQDEDIAVIPLGNLKGLELANLRMKAFTKAKRRVTLSICGLGMIDESELDTIRNVKASDNPQIENPFKKIDAPPIEVASQPVKDIPLSDYVCKVGKKYAGKALKDIDMFELDGYLSWLKKSSQERQQELAGDWLEFYEHAEAYLCSLETKNEELG